MAVAPDNVKDVAGTAISTLTTAAFTITSATNRAALLGLIMNNNSSGSFSATCGTVAGALVTGSDSTTTKQGRTQIWGVKNPSSGSQTASMSWTGSDGASLGVITASGVDQTTSFNGGTFASGLSTTPAVTVTTPSGDMSFDCAWVANQVSAPAQTQVWIDSVVTGGGGSRKTTISNTGATHSWTQASGNWVDSGANMINDGAGAGWGALIGLKNNRLVGVA